MRGILVLLGLAALAAVVLMSLGMLNIQMQQGQWPQVSFDMKGGQLPKVKADTGSIDFTTTNKTVQVPVVEMKNTTVTLPTIEVKQAPAPAEKK